MDRETIIKAYGYKKYTSLNGMCSAYMDILYNKEKRIALSVNGYFDLMLERKKKLIVRKRNPDLVKSHKIQLELLLVLKDSMLFLIEEWLISKSVKINSLPNSVVPIVTESLPNPPTEYLDLDLLSLINS